MDNTTLLTILGLIVVIVILFLIIALSFKWLLFGLSILFKKISSKNNVGLYLMRSKGGNFNLPKVVDLNKKEEEFTIGGRKQILPINRDDFENNGLWFGLPYKLANDDDVKTSIGMHYQATDEKGESVLNADGTPTLTLVRNSVSVSGDMLKALVDEKAISDALRDFLKKNQMILILMIGALIIGGVNAYISFEVMSNVLPAMETLVRSAISEINNKLDLILVAVS
jgi:hypothetical protein